MKLCCHCCAPVLFLIWGLTRVLLGRSGQHARKKMFMAISKLNPAVKSLANSSVDYVDSWAKIFSLQSAFAEVYGELESAIRALHESG